MTFQLLQEDYNRTPAQRLLKEIQEARKHIPQLREQLSRATGSPQVAALPAGPRAGGVPSGSVLENAAVVLLA